MKALADQKGLSLVELLVAMAILSVVAIPFLSVFLSSARNNADSAQVLKAATLARNAMMEMKSRSPAELQNDPDAVYYEDSQLKVTYQITSLAAPGITSGTGLLVTVSYVLEMNVNAGTVQLLDSSGTDATYDLTGIYRLDIAGSGSPYTYRFSRVGDGTLLASGQLAVQDQNLNLHIGISPQRSATDPRFFLHVAIDPAFPAAENPNFFISGAADECVLYNDGQRNFYQFSNNRNDSQPTSAALYKIIVEARTRDQARLLERLVSFELK